MIRTLGLCAILLTAALPSCVAIDGSHSGERPTTGKQLLDLKAALDSGAITQGEYDSKKAQILAAK